MFPGWWTASGEWIPLPYVDEAAAETAANAPTKCPNCGEPKASHRVCMKCGYYKGQAVVEVKSTEEKE